MFQQFFAGSDLLILPVIALGIFFVTFVLVVFQALSGWRRKDHWSRVARLPLDDESSVRVPTEKGGLSS